MGQEIHTQATRGEVRALIWALIQGLSGSGSDHAQLVRGIKLRVGLTALGLITKAFDDKSQHQTGEDGIKWAELSPATIAARRLNVGDRQMLKGMGIKNRDALRPFLTPAQDRRWKMLFATRKSWLMAKGADEGTASAIAAASAWTILKAEGARTKLEVLGSRLVEIGKDTGRLAMSVSPGITDPSSFPLDADPPEPDTVPESQPGDRILRDEPGAVVVGSNVEYAARFHAKRPLWPQSLPSSWTERLTEVCRGAVLEAIGLVVEGRG